MCRFVTEWPVTDFRHVILPSSSKLHRFQNTNRHLKIKKLLFFANTALQVGRSRVRFPMVSLEFFFDTVLFGCIVALRSTQPLTEMSKVYPCTGTEALYRPYGPWGSTGIALLFLDYGTRWGWGVSVTPRSLFTPGKDPVPIVQEAGWATGPVWRGTENLVPPGFDPRTVQPLASRYTDWATRLTNRNEYQVYFLGVKAAGA
jgi:hypothetical protein